MSERVKLADAGLITSLSDTDNFLMERNGAIGRGGASLVSEAALAGRDIAQLDACVFILTGYQYGTMPDADLWEKSFKANGALGVAIWLPGLQPLVVALDEATDMYWNTEAVVCNKAGDAWTNYSDMDGEANTAAIVASANYAGGTSCAPGWCNAYSKTVTETGYGYPAGEWWLPSLGELLAIKAHLYAVNYALTVAGGTPITLGSDNTDAYWSSSEINSLQASNLFMTRGGSLNYNKVSNSMRVRPVSRMHSPTAM